MAWPQRSRTQTAAHHTTKLHTQVKGRGEGEINSLHASMQACTHGLPSDLVLKIPLEMTSGAIHRTFMVMCPFCTASGLVSKINELSKALILTVRLSCTKQFLTW